MFNLKKIVSAAIAGAMILSTLPMAYATTDPVLYSEDFEGSPADRVGTGAKDLQVTRVADNSAGGHFEFVAEDGNQYVILKDKYVQPGQYDYGRLNVVAQNNTIGDLTGTFAVETKFQIPDLRTGARYYPITAFYEEGDLTGNWNRGELAKFVYVQYDSTTENFQFRVSDYVPEDVTEETSAYTGATIATAEAGKWYTLKLVFDIDGDATTVDTFRYELTDGTDVYTGNGGAVGNCVTTSGSYPGDAHFDLTSLYKLAFGYIWDEKTASEADPTTIYLDDISVRTVSDATPITLTSSSPAADAEDVAIDGAIELTFSGDITDASAQDIKLTPAADVTIEADGNTVIITPDEDLEYGKTYTVTIPTTLVNTDGAEVISNSFKFTTEQDPDQLFIEDFEGAVENRVGTGDKALKVTRVADNSASGHFEFVTEDDDQYVVLKDMYVQPGQYDYGRLNVVAIDNANTDYTGRFSVETKFQIPDLRDGAKYYPITAFYTEADFNKAGAWNRGELARFVYIVKDGEGFSFKVSNAAPENTAVTTLTDSGTTIAAAEAGKWYTLKLTFNIDENAETLDTFSYELTDGTNNYAGDNVVVGNKCGYQSITDATRYNLTSIYKLAYGYIWDETTASEEDPTTIYLNDISVRRAYAPITLVSSDPAANAADVALDKTITLTFSEAVTEASAQNITITPAVDAEITASGATVTINPDDDLAYGKTYTVTVPSTVANAEGRTVTATSFKFTTIEDPDLLLSEDFQGDMTGKISQDRDKAFSVTRVADKYGNDHYAIETEANSDNKYIKLMDKYVQPGDYDYGRLNVIMEQNTVMNKAGTFAVETKFQMPDLRDGAKYYPITAFYTEADFNKAGAWNRGELARFVYIVKDGEGFSFKVSNAAPENTAVETLTDGGTTIAAAEAGKWYTLKLTFNIDGNAETLDTFSYELTDGTNNYTGDDVVVGNKCGYQSITDATRYNLTSIYKLAFGYIWDETTASAEDPTTIYLDDISIRDVEIINPITLVSSDPAANAENVALDKTITLTFSEAVTEASAQNITITPDVDASITASGATVTIDPAADLAYGTEYTVTVPSTVANAAGTTVTPASFKFTTIEDSDLLFAEDFEDGAANRVGGSDKALQVTRVADSGDIASHFELVTGNNNTYLKLMDKYVQPGQYDYGRLNVDARDNVNSDLTGNIAVETKFQIPDLRDGAKYYPITAFYEAADLTGNWNRGLLARFVYVVKDGDGFSFKVSTAVPENTAVTDVTNDGTTIATAEAGKWYTLKLVLDIDGDAETIDRFSYNLTDGTNTYTGLGGAIGNKVGSSALAGNGAKYNLTSLHKLSFGYIWDETTASVEDPTTIYLDDIDVRYTDEEVEPEEPEQPGPGSDDLLSEDFQGDMTGRITQNRDADYSVTRVADKYGNDHYAIETEANSDNKYIKLMDKYIAQDPSGYDYGRLNVILEQNTVMNKAGTFAVETKFQMPDLRNGAKYYPITAFYTEADFNKAGAWNRGDLARFVYVQKDEEGFSFKVSNATPADTTVTTITNAGTTIAAAEAGKWYTLKLTFNIDENAETLDTFSYDLTDGTNSYTGDNVVVGNKAGYDAISDAARYNLTSIYKIAFGYIWDETTASAEDPTTIYLDDLSIKNVVLPIKMVSSSPAADAENVAIDKSITLTFSEAVTEASAQNITITPDVAKTITAEGNVVTIDPTADLAYGETYTVTIPATVVNADGKPVEATSFSFTVVEEGQEPEDDVDVIMSEDFQGDIADRISADRAKDFSVTRVADTGDATNHYAIETEADSDNKYIKLMDKYVQPGAYDYGRLNVVMEYNKDMNLTGRFTVQTRFQMPDLRDGAKYYPITAFYEAGDLSGSWNRGNLARFVYVVKDGDGFSFKVSSYTPADTTSDTKISNTGKTFAAAEAGKWYTLKLNFFIDEDATTVDTFSYELTDGTNIYAGNGGAVGNKAGTEAISTAPKYNLTSLYKLAFGYVWDETTASVEDPTTIYLDDIVMNRVHAATYTSSIEDGATDVAVDSNIVLTFNRDMKDENLDKIVVYEGDVEKNIICQTTKTYNAEDMTITIAPVATTFKYGREYTVVISNRITDVNGINIDKGQISFTTKTMPTDGVTINTPSITGSVAAGQTVSGTATFTKNTYASAEKVTFMAVAYDANGTKVGIGYIEDNFANSDDVTLNFNFTIPSTAVGTGKVKLMVWDSFENMESVADIWTQN